MKFRGWHTEDEKEDVGRWETFTVVLHAEEAGDLIEGQDMKKALKASGYKLTLSKIKRSLTVGLLVMGLFGKAGAVPHVLKKTECTGTIIQARVGARKSSLIIDVREPMLLRLTTDDKTLSEDSRLNVWRYAKAFNTRAPRLLLWRVKVIRWSEGDTGILRDFELKRIPQGKGR